MSVNTENRKSYRMIFSLLQDGMRFQGDKSWVTETVLFLGWGLMSSDAAELLYRSI